MSAREADPDGTPNVVLTMPIFTCNHYMQQQWDDFIRNTNAPGGDKSLNPHFDDEAYEFYLYLSQIPERHLEAYGNARNKMQFDATSKILVERYEKNAPQIRRFWEMSTLPGYCYLTKYGCTHRLNLAGVCSNTNRGESLETEEHTMNEEHYSDVNVALARRIKTDQVFGCADDATTGVKTWVELFRTYCGVDSQKRHRWGAFQLRPRCWKDRDFPSFRHLQYRDLCGCLNFGYYWVLGTIIEPGTSSPPLHVLGEFFFLFFFSLMLFSFLRNGKQFGSVQESPSSSKHAWSFTIRLHLCWIFTLKKKSSVVPKKN